MKASEMALFIWEKIKFSYSPIVFVGRFNELFATYREMNETRNFL